MTKAKHYHNWHIETDQDHIVWLRFDREHSDINTIDHKVLDELAAILTDLATQTAIKGLIIASAKPNMFIAGADIEQFSKFDSDQALAFLEKGQLVFTQLANFPLPTVALIAGVCLGGGCELALACRYRVMQEDAKTRIGLPEILLGIHPGWGGTVRLPRLVGAFSAMDLILSGRTVSGKEAARIGLVDVAVPDREIVRAARHYILQQPKKHQPAFWEALSNQVVVRPLIAKFLQKKVAQKANPKYYPAPYAVINNWSQVGVDDVAQALRVEVLSVLKIAMGDTARNLVRLFFLQNRLKSLSKGTDLNVTRVHVVGAGIMGGDIAAWCALHGLRVTLQDREAKFIAPAIKRAYDLFKKKLKAPRLIQDAMDRLTPDPEGLGVARADIIIEAIYEDLKAKQQLFKHIESHCKPEAILATNTSSIPLDEINTVLKKPERLVGIHFFNPVAMMQLVEVVQGKITLPEVTKKALAFVRHIDRLPLPVKSSPGFLVNRVLMAYLMEAMLMLTENVPPEVIDHAAVSFGMPMGPVQLADTVGLDVCLAVAKNLTAHFGGTVSAQLEQMVKEGHLGRKTGKGFYQYKNGKLIKDKFAEAEVQPDITDRLILRLINESVACLREEVVADADLLDAGMVFGTGFAPFRGGPMHYAQARGLQNIYEQLQQFAEQYGPRFAPDAGWKNILK